MHGHAPLRGQQNGRRQSRRRRFSLVRGETRRIRSPVRLRHLEKTRPIIVPMWARSSGGDVALVMGGIDGAVCVHQMSASGNFLHGSSGLIPTCIRASADSTFAVRTVSSRYCLWPWNHASHAEVQRGGGAVQFVACRMAFSMRITPRLRCRRSHVKLFALGPSDGASARRRKRAGTAISKANSR